MTATRRRPTDTSQPELPLCQNTTEDLPPRERGWRLDEHTREIGLRGVAQARARLERSETSSDHGRRRGGPGRAGRAA